MHVKGLVLQSNPDQAPGLKAKARHINKGKAFDCGSTTVARRVEALIPKGLRACLQIFVASEHSHSVATQLSLSFGASHWLHVSADQMRIHIATSGTPPRSVFPLFLVVLASEELGKKRGQGLWQVIRLRLTNSG